MPSGRSELLSCTWLGYTGSRTVPPVFTILTREPAAAISFIHDRTPVILPKEAVSDWLNIRYDARDVLAGAVQDVECWLA